MNKTQTAVGTKPFIALNGQEAAGVIVKHLEKLASAVLEHPNFRFHLGFPTLKFRIRIEVEGHYYTALAETIEGAIPEAPAPDGAAVEPLVGAFEIDSGGEITIPDKARIEAGLAVPRPQKGLDGSVVDRPVQVADLPKRGDKK